MAQKNIRFTVVLFNKHMNKLFSIFALLMLLCAFNLVPAQDAASVATETVVGNTSDSSDTSGVELEQRVFEIARKVRCPVCRAESAADSNATTSIEFRNIIQEKLEEGQSEAEIIAFFQASYGDWILLSPPKRGFHLVVWIAPLVAAVLALIVFLVLLRRWTRKANAAPIVLTAAEMEQVRQALEESEYKPDTTGEDS